MTKRSEFLLPTGQILKLRSRKSVRKSEIQRTREKIQSLLNTADEIREGKRMTPEQVREQLRRNRMREEKNAHNR